MNGVVRILGGSACRNLDLDDWLGDLCSRESIAYSSEGDLIDLGIFFLLQAAMEMELKDQYCVRNY